MGWVQRGKGELSAAVVGPRTLPPEYDINPSQDLLQGTTPQNPDTLGKLRTIKGHDL